MNKIILVDGNNLLFRSYYATAYQGVIMKNSKGFPTNALYGFINMMNKIISEENPSYILVAFDKGKTFRHDKYESYKDGRSETPDELKMQFPEAKKILKAMGIKSYEIDNYEADDIIGTLSRIVDEEDKFIATIVSSDKDLLQLISDEVTVKLLKQKGHIMMDKKEFKDTYKVDPIRMIDLKALMGDSSDNIPGVKGIGEKTAINLLSKYDSLDNLYKNIDSVTGKTKEKLINDKDNAYMSYDLATIYKEVPIDFTLDDCKYNGENKNEYVKLLKEYEFFSLLRKLDVKEEKKEEEKLVIKDIKDFKEKEFSFYLETRGEVYSKSEILGIGIYDGKNGYFINKDEISKYKDIFNSKVDKYTYDYKKNLVVLNNIVSFNNVCFDTEIATYLLDYNIKDDIAFVARVFDYDIDLYEDIYGTLKRPKEVSLDKLKEVCIKKAKFIYETKDRLVKELEDNDETKLFTDIEMPLTEVLADMELTGIKVDREYLEKLEKDLKKQMEVLEKEIHELAGEDFNIMSPAQLSKILFEKLEIPYPKRVKNGKYSTSKDILDKIKFVNPIVDKVLEYRTLSKLYTNYAVGLINEIREDGRIHTIFTQTLTRTGRLSSISPNLQNIPARSDYSALIRKAFIPDDNSKLLSSDYSQVELRIFASLSNEENLIQAFKDGKDIHAKTASDIYNIDIKDVKKDQRRTAKAVNFGILYGISSFGLSEDLGIDMKTAKEFIDKYLETFPGIKKYMDNLISDAYKNGYVTTLMNRKRILDELKSKNYMVRSSGERMALNTPIQGTAADILKKTGQLIIVSAPSGAGKDTVVRELMKKDNTNRWVSVSATSREPRKGEKDGVDYYFLSKEEFEEKIKEDYFLEYAEYAGNYYGTPKEYIKKNLDKGIDVILIIEIQGASLVKKQIPEALLIFIMPPSLKTLVKRLKKRGTDSNDKIIKRFHTAYNEINEVTKYNYVVVNDKLEDAVNKVESIITSEKCRVDRIEEVYLDTKEEEIHELLMDEEFINEGISKKID